MRFLVTADVHLSADHPERLEALEEVVDAAEDEDVDFLLVAGDLFDGAADVEDLKPEIRGVFSGNSFHCFVTLGNHDADAYRDEDYFGDDVSVLRSRPFEAIDVGDVRLLALPYTDDGFDDVVDDLYDARRPDGTNALMLHGTLSTEKDGGFGGETRYLPFTPEQLLETGVDVVFAGHVHSRPTRKTFGDDGVEFVYPGSPASTTRKETGRRGAWMYDSEARELRVVDLSTHHYVVEEVDVVPGDEDSEIEALRRRLEGRSLDDAEVVVEPRGYVEGSPEEFLRRVEEAVEDAGADSYTVDRGGVDNASAVVDTELYSEFEQKLSGRDVDADVDVVRRLFLEAMSKEERA